MYTLYNKLPKLFSSCREIKIKKDDRGNIQVKQNEEDLIIMTKGKSIDYFVLIIEGKIFEIFFYYDSFKFILWLRAC